jgi:hypothetical protein
MLGGIQGLMQRPTMRTDRNYQDFEHTRFSLRNGWNTSYTRQLNNAGRTRVITPFRAVNNAGDLLARRDYTCGGTSQQSSNLRGLGNRIGSVHDDVCDGTGVPAATCNPKYVYDSSDYIRFKKQGAVVLNYNANK